MSFMSKKQPTVTLPEPKIIYSNAVLRVIERPSIQTKSHDGQPLSFILELCVESNTPDSLHAPAWTFVGTESNLTSYNPYMPGSTEGWKAFFAVIHSIPRSSGV